MSRVMIRVFLIVLICAIQSKSAAIRESSVWSAGTENRRTDLQDAYSSSYTPANFFKKDWYKGKDGACPFGDLETCALEELRTCPWDGWDCRCSEPVVPSSVVLKDLQGGSQNGELEPDKQCVSTYTHRRHPDHRGIYAQSDGCVFTPKTWNTPDSLGYTDCYITPPKFNVTCMANYSFCSYKPSGCGWDNPGLLTALHYNPKTCPELPKVANGTWNYTHAARYKATGKTGACGSEAQMVCENCFELQNPTFDKMTCDGTGWKDPQGGANLPVCVTKVSNCAGEPPDAPKFGHLLNPNASTLCGAERNYTCQGCYGLSGIARSICRTDGTWSPITAKCTLNTCPSPPDVPNSNGWSYTHWEYKGTFFPSYRTLSTGTVAACNTEILTHCNYCHKPATTVVNKGNSTHPVNVSITGNTERWCIADKGVPGYFNGTQPTSCTLSTCPALPAVQYGTWQFTHQNGYGSGTTGSCGTVATLVCDNCFCPHYGNVTRTCKLDTATGEVAWTGKTAVCTPTHDWCPANPPSAPQFGAVKYSLGKSAKACAATRTYGCNECYRISSGNDTSICQPNTLWSKPNPVCTIGKCPAPATPQNGAAWNFAHAAVNGVTHGAGNVGACGTTITSSCNTCYKLTSGNLTRTCNYTTERYNGGDPQCTLKTCAARTADPNGNWAYVHPGTFGLPAGSAQGTCGSTATLNCSKCYKVTGAPSATVTCTTGDQWNGGSPKCTGIAGWCGGASPAAPANGNRVCSGTGDSCGDSCTYTCNPGFQLNGQSTSMCQASGSWSNKVRSCDPITCQVPNPPKYAKSWATTVAAQGACNSVLTSACECATPTANFQLTCNCTQTSGSYVLTQGSMPVCKPKTCQFLSQVEQGTWSYSHRLNMGFAQNLTADIAGTCNSNATLTCNPCFKIKAGGSQVRSCNGTGWSGVQPECEVDTTFCPANPPAAPGNGSLGGTARTCNTTRSYSCKECWALGGTTKTSCTAVSNGWTPANPTCTLASCAAPNQPANAYPLTYTHKTINGITGTGTTSANLVGRCGTTVTAACKYCHKVTSGHATRMCQSSTIPGFFNGSDPVCSLKTTAPLPNVSNGYWNYVHQPGYGSGQGPNAIVSCHTVASLLCDKCYEPNATFQSANYDGDKWEHPVNLQCVGKNDWCMDAPPDAPDNGQRVGSGTSCGATRTYTCNACYKLNIGTELTSVTSSCQSNHKWSVVDVSCHPVKCFTLPPPVANAEPWSYTGTTEEIGCGQTINTTCNYCYSARVGNLTRTCMNLNNTHTRYSGKNPVCSLDTCPALPNDPNGDWSFTHVDGYGNATTGSCGSQATLTCKPCYWAQWTEGNAIKNAATYTRDCNGKAWSGSMGTCVMHQGLCDADFKTVSNGMQAKFNFQNLGANNSVCGDSVTYSCPRCAKFNIPTYPNEEHAEITRTCQADGKWSGESSFECTFDNYRTYSVNMLTTSAATSRTNYGLKLSPYECKHNITLCPECQTAINKKCRESADVDKSLPRFTACGSIAKNLCPKRCDQGARICNSCELTPRGITHCAATAKCICNGSWVGDGCHLPYVPPNATEVTPPAQNTDTMLDDWPWWWWIPAAVVGYCLAHSLAVACYQENFGRPHHPRLVDLCGENNQGACWYMTWYYCWYYYILGCFCATSPDAKDSDTGTGCWYTGWFACWYTTLCGFMCYNPAVHGTQVDASKANDFDPTRKPTRYPRAPVGTMELDQPRVLHDTEKKEQI